MRLIAKLTVFPLLVAIPGSTMGLPYPPASEWTQILNHAQLVISAAQQARQLATQLKEFKHMTIQGQLFTAMQFSQFSKDIVDLGKNIKQGMGLSYTMSHLDNAFRMSYPGYINNHASFDSQYRGWTSTVMDTLAGVLGSLNIHMNQLQTDEQTLAVIRNYARTSTGQNQLLQAGTMLADMQVTSLDKLRVLMMAQVQAEATWTGHQMNNEAVQQQIRQNAYGSSLFVPTN